MTARPRQVEALPPLADSPEDELVAAARSGSEPAVRELIRRLNPRLFRVARGITGNDAEAEDVLQETYLAAFTRLDGFRAEARFSTWITRIAINHALMRARRAHPLEELDTVTEDESSRILSFPNREAELPEAALGRTQLRQLLEEVISTLPPDLRLSYGQFWCTGSSGGLLLGFSDGLAIAELDAVDELAEAVGTVELAPVPLG